MTEIWWLLPFAFLLPLFTGSVVIQRREGKSMTIDVDVIKELCFAVEVFLANIAHLV